VASETGGHHGLIRCVSAGNGGGLMLTGGHDGMVCVWVVDTPDMALSDGYIQTALGISTEGEQLMRCCHVLWGHDSPVVMVDFNLDLDVAVSSSESGWICLHTL